MSWKSQVHQRGFFYSEDKQQAEADAYEKRVEDQEDESESGSDHPELDEDFEMNADLGMPSFGAANNEHYLW